MDAIAENVSLGSTFTAHAVTFERPLSDPEPAFHAVDPTGRFWPKAAIVARSARMTARGQERTFGDTTWKVCS